MAIVSGYQKMKDYIKQSSGYKLLSRWANANTVECDDAQTVQSKIGGITGISSSLTANSSTQAASTQLTNQLYQNIKKIRIYVGSDGKLHFIYSTGADTVIPFRGGGIAYIACVSSGGAYPNNTEYVIDKDTTVKILTTNDYMHVFLNNEEVHLTEIGTKDVTWHIGSWYAEISATKGDIVKISTSAGGGVAYSISY